MAKKPLPVYLTEEQRGAVSKEATRVGLTKSAVICQLIQKYLVKKK